MVAGDNIFDSSAAVAAFNRLIEFSYFSLSLLNDFLLLLQTVTPHMQPSAAKVSNSRKIHGNFSVDLWKKAFKDARERLCPIRAGGHECGCLPLLARLVMNPLLILDMHWVTESGALYAFVKAVHRPLAKSINAYQLT